MPVNNAQQNRSWLYSAVLFLCIIQPCLDVISYWMDIWRADNTVTLALRFILLIMVIACAWSISDHKRVYGAMTLCSVLLIAGHVITCLRSFGQAYNLSWIFSDIANYFRVLQLPFFAMAMITAFRQAEDREELYDVMEKAFLINFIIILLVTAFLKAVLKNPYVQAVLRGLKPCMIGIILATGVYMIIRNGIVIQDSVLMVRPLILTLVLGALYFGSRKIKKGGISPILLICISAAAGIAAYGL